ncbi:MAG: TraR/DksA family transcriptional regulator [Pseudomonadota bacterium]
MSGNAATRNTLSSKLSQLEERAARIKADISEPMSADFEEQAVEAEDDEALIGENTVAMEKIGAVRAAIRRVDEGRYGICIMCGEAISPERLAAIPEAGECIDCAKGMAA